MSVSWLVMAVVVRQAVSANVEVAAGGKLTDGDPLPTEVTYVLKYAEENGRSNGRPWSIRQSVAYHQTAANGTQTWILLHPLRGSAFQKRIEGILRQKDGSQKLLDPLNLHVSHMASYAENWKRYVAHLTADLSKAAGRIQSYRLE